MRIGLTGGIGSGKSTVAALLAAHGAVVIDADAIAREVVEPGTPGLARIVALFGPDVVDVTGGLDRGKLATIVFNDPVKLQRLNDIVHPLVAIESGKRLQAAKDAPLAVYDVPLLVENHLEAGFDAVVVVDAPDDLRVRRLVARGLNEADVRARMAVQATRDERLAVADRVVPNAGSRADLEAAVAALWSELVS